MKAQTTQRSYARSQQRIQTIRTRDQARAQSSQLSDIEELHKVFLTFLYRYYCFLARARSNSFGSSGKGR